MENRLNKTANAIRKCFSFKFFLFILKKFGKEIYLAMICVYGIMYNTYACYVYVAMPKQQKRNENRNAWFV